MWEIISDGVSFFWHTAVLKLKLKLNQLQWFSASLYYFHSYVTLCLLLSVRPSQKAAPFLVFTFTLLLNKRSQLNNRMKNKTINVCPTQPQKARFVFVFLSLHVL